MFEYHRAPTRSSAPGSPGRVGDQRRRRRHLAVVVAAVSIATGSAATTAAADGRTARTEATASASPEVRTELMRLECAGRDGDVASIGCRWSVPDAATGIRLIRIALGSGMGRVTVHRTDDPTANTYVDSPVRRGVRYVYAVRAIDASGRLVGASRPVVAGVALPEPTGVEVLRLQCASTGAVTVRCAWSAPATPARVLTLWRSVDGGPRERVASFTGSFPTSYGDQVPASSSRAFYAVIATDGGGEIVARSRADGVTFPDVVPDVEVVPDAPPPVETRPVETRPVETAPPETRPVETAPPETRPVETRPVETRPPETRPAETRPVETAPPETRPVATDPAPRRPADTRPVDTQPVETRPAETRPDRAEVATTRDGDRTN